MEDLFGDASLFAEFEKEREADNSFIRYNENADKSKIIFEGFDESEDEESDIEWSQENDIVLSTTAAIPAAAAPASTKKGNEDEEGRHDKAKGESEPSIQDHSTDQKGATVETKDEEGELSEENHTNDHAPPDPDVKVGIEEGKKGGNDQSQNESGESELIEINQQKSNEKPNIKDNNELNKKLGDTPNNATKDNIKKKESRPTTTTTSEKMLDEDDTAWLYQHLYKNEKVTKDDKETMKQIIYERNKYHRYSKILDTTRYVPDEDSPAIQLIFNNTPFSRKYRQQIEQFIKGLLWQEFNSNNPETVTEIDVKPGAPSCVDINEKLRSDQRNEKMRQNHALLGSGQFHKQFLIDFLGWAFKEAEPPRCNINWDIPLYGQVFDEVYADPSIKPVKPANKKQKNCWNCGHENCSISECRLPRNQARINQNRKLFMEQQQNRSQPKFTGASRYHLDPDIASKFNKFRPGVISDKLREAIGLKKDQLPQYIYKMRLFGYPPGWLHEAKQVESGVSIYGKEGRATLCTGDQLEDGELNDPSDKSEYDVNKIVEFPGFTIPTPLGIMDEHVVFKMPPIQQHQLKKTLVTQSEEKAAAKKRKLEKEAEEAKKEEIPAKKARIEIKEEGEVTEDNTESNEKGVSENNDEKMDVKEKIDQNESKVEEKEGQEMEDQKINDDDKEKDASQTQAKESPSTSVATPKSKDAHSSSTISLSKDFGTPILVRHKTALPDASKFAVGAEEHIPFENLPDATGTFEKMKNIIDIIRKKKQD